MTVTYATAVPDNLLELLPEKSLFEIAEELPYPVRLRTEFSNLLAEVDLDGGRVLMLKEPRHYRETAASRFETCRRVGRWLAEAGVVAPQHLELPGIPPERLLLAYWRIDLPTLNERWPELGDRQKTTALRELGRMLRRVHRPRSRGYGPVLEEEAADSLEEFLTGDLLGRLRPAVVAEWPEALPVLDRLAGAVPGVAGEAGEAVLNHNDLHMSNILCAADGAGSRCVGLLDLEAAVSLPPEADFARLAVYHGPLFGQPLTGPWFQRVWEGYGRPLHPRLLSFFSAYHLLNIGFHTACTGNGAHAWRVLEAAAVEAGGVR